MYTEYELEELEKGLFEEKERTRKELEELEKEIARTGVGPEDDDYIREELLSKELAYADASIALKDYLSYMKLRRFHALH